MTIKIIEGFEVHQTQASIQNKWNGEAMVTGETADGLIVLTNSSIIAGSISDSALRISTSSGALILTTPTYATPFTTAVVGFRVRGAAMEEGTGTSVAFRTGTTTHVSFYYFDNGNGTYRWEAYRGVSLSNQLASSSPINDNEWVYMEFKVVISNTTGSVEIRANGAAVASATNVDTQQNATANMNRIAVSFACGAGGDTIDLDDLYILDGDGGEQDDFLGECVVEGHVPTSDDSANWTPSTGADNYAMVDDNGVEDDDSTYVSTTDQDSLETYGFPDFDLPGAGDFLAIQVTARQKLTSAGSRETAFVIRDGSTSEEPITYDVANNSYDTYRGVLELNPHTGVPFTTTDMNDYAFGLRAIT